MFVAVATQSGWQVSREGKAEVIATFAKLGTVKDTVEKMGGVLKIFINGYEVN